VQVQSTVGEGSVFELRLPASADLAAMDLPLDRRAAR
jgi:chemotaxis protein histidine kinase CheA